MIDIGLFQNLAIGIMTTLVTFVIHAIALDRLIRLVLKLQPKDEHSKRHQHVRQVIVLIVTAFGIICVHSLEIWLWAFLYLGLDIKEIVNMEHALYYSLASFSTLGPSGISVSEDFRILSGIQGSSGMILFGWSTAFLFEVMAITYKRFDIRRHSHHD